MNTARLLVAEGHAKRKSENIPLKKPLAHISLETSISYSDITDEVWTVILEELNAFNIQIHAKQVFPKVEILVSEDELEHMANSRTLIRSIQAMRKELGYTISQQIVVQLPEEFKTLPKKLLDAIATETVATTITWGNTLHISIG